MRNPRRYSIGKAAKALGLCSRTLLRAEEAERVQFIRRPNGWRFILEADLQMLPVFSIGAAARISGMPRGRIRRLARQVERRSPASPFTFPRGRWFSLQSLKAFAEGKVDTLVARYRRSVWVTKERGGQVRRTERRSQVVSYHPRLDG